MNEEQNINQLPKGWKRQKMGTIFTIERGGSPRPIEDFITDDSNGINWIKIGDTKGVVKYIYKTKEKIKPAGASRSRMVYEDDFILSNSMSFGKPFIMKTTGCIHDGWLVIRKNESIDDNFLYYILSSPVVFQQFTKLAKGSTVKNLNIEAVKQVELGIPPKPIQQAIVSKIEELFSALDKGIENLRLAQQQLKTYRQAVLKWAFEGKLTNENVKERELPTGWKEVLLKDVCKIVGGVTKGRDFKGKETILLPYLRVANVQDGYLDLDEIKMIEVLPFDKEKYKLLFGDILYTEGGDKDKLGRGTIWKDEIKDCIHQNHIFRARPLSNEVDSKYIAYFSQTRVAKNYFFKHGKQTTNLASINLTILSNLPVPICVIEEQRNIVQEIESRLSVADKMEESITQSLKQAEVLRQSILKKAFEGRLVKEESNPVQRTQAKIIPIERKILAGKIIHLMHEEKYFGLTKFQKMLYLVENFSQVEYDTNFIQERAGPYDKEFTLAFRKEMKDNDWFDEEQKGSITKFVPGEQVGKLIKDYAKYFRTVGPKIVFVIQQMQDKSSHDAELIATLYAVWNNRLIKREPVKLEYLIEDFFNWSPKKKEEFQKEEIVTTYDWMKKVKLLPIGFGKIIDLESK